jgi:hypothetical protein
MISYWCCPRLLELDLRHGEDHRTWPRCRRRDNDAELLVQLQQHNPARSHSHCSQDHEHEQVLHDFEGHENGVVTWDGNPPEPHECSGCSQLMVWSAGDPFPAKTEA